MKMVVAYIEPESFEPIREELLGLGFLSLSAWEASGSVPEPTSSGSYRGVAVENHLRPKTRFECVVGPIRSPPWWTRCSGTPLTVGSSLSSRSSRLTRPTPCWPARPWPAAG